MTASFIPLARAGVWLLALLLLAAVTSQHHRPVVAQGNGAAAIDLADPAEGAAAEDAAVEVERIASSPETIGTLVLKSGMLSVGFYALLFLFSIVAVMVALERFVNLRRSKVIPQAFSGALREAVAGGYVSHDRLRMLSDSAQAPIARILRAGVLRAGRPLPEVEKSMEDAAAREMADMRARNRPLSVVGNIAPLVGLLGTVVGMIFAFSTASQVGLGKADELAKGIYLALMTTAGGLAIAIPSLLAAAWLNARAEKFMREIDESLLETMPSFARLERSAGSVAPARAHEPEPAEII
jgi:biopolymer transport protein ExbB